MTADSTAKLRELMLYIAAKTEKTASFGSIKMNKALYYSDFIWYAKTGKSMTGVTYHKRDFGPVPRGLLPVQEALIKAEEAELLLRPTPLPNGEEKRLIAKRKPQLDGLFTADQIALVDEIIEELAPWSAHAVSDATHQHLGWLLAEYAQDIPYYTVFLDDAIAKPSDIERGIELAAERGWKSTANTAP